MRAPKGQHTIMLQLAIGAIHVAEKGCSLLLGYDIIAYVQVHGAHQTEAWTCSI